MTAAVLGGDMRQVHLARLLCEDGCDVVTWGLEKGGGPCGAALEEALDRDVLIFPLPMCRDGQLLLPLAGSPAEAETLWTRVDKGSLLLGGMPGALEPVLREHGLSVVDYYRREELQVANAAITAEGAIQRAMEETDGALLGARVLLLGFGRIGKLLALRLQALGARVAVAARSYDQLAWARALGMDGLRIGLLTGRVGAYEVIFNTVPAPILTGALLAETAETCLLLELASSPGGIAAGEAGCLKRRLVAAPGLPGVAAPRAAALAIRDTIYHILEERGDPI